MVSLLLNHGVWHENKLITAVRPVCRKKSKADEDEDMKDEDEDEEPTKKEEREDETKDAEAIEVRDVRYSIENLERSSTENCNLRSEVWLQFL